MSSGGGVASGSYTMPTVVQAFAAAGALMQGQVSCSSLSSHSLPPPQSVQYSAVHFLLFFLYYYFFACLLACLRVADMISMYLFT
jgi:hypothetical protein